MPREVPIAALARSCAAEYAFKVLKAACGGADVVDSAV